MYPPPKSFFTKLVEGALLFAVAAYLIRLGICMISSVWQPIVIITAVFIAAYAGVKIYAHYKNTHF